MQSDLRLSEEGERVLRDALLGVPKRDRTGFEDLYRWMIGRREMLGLELRAEPITLEEEKVGSAMLADSILDELLDAHQGRETLTADAFFARWYRAGSASRDLPGVASLLVAQRCLPKDEARTLVHDAWVTPEFPEANAETSDWLEAFRFTGWVSDDPDVVDAPTWRTQLLFRGATEDRRLGMGWTGDLEQAQWFADRFTGIGDSFVWQATVPGHRLLARFIGRGEDEWVVDTNGLTVSPRA